MAILWTILVISFVLSKHVLAISVPLHEDSLVVDLGYARYKAGYNDTEHIYTFKNIRFGDPPLRQHRFKPPRPVSTVNRNVNDGSVGFKCPQAYPEWFLKSRADAAGITTEALRDNLLNDNTMNEDCLFLDKDSTSFDPSGLLATSIHDRGEGVIFVALNYRLGLFGWLNGLGDEDIFPNSALQDQRLGLKWVKKYIHLFGGDPARVTVFGESAGGGSIMHHITGDGGRSKVPFERAIIQSPGWLTSLPIVQLWNQTLVAASRRAGRPITNGSDLASLNYTTLLRVNSDIVYKSNYGDFGYGPTVDGGFVPAFPGVSLLKGDFDKSVELMLGHNSHESDIFTSPAIDSREKIVTNLRSSIHGITDSAIDRILTDLYPPPQQTDLYTTEYGRAALLRSEYTFVCNTRYLAISFNNMTWSYRFEVPPGNHAQDLAYTFHKPGDANVSSDLAVQMQTYFTRFAASGNPNKPGSGPKWQLYGENAHIATFGGSGVGTATDDAKNGRCVYWQEGTYTTELDS
ncbi:lysophospholipase [Purpureocillium lavendulum]|uniref:Carboxylic ester hydrolase n=1 Tax=Purpureocillium lavendulum TaxID=1247861 RepID=A0AB34FM36_9HYPO|nr:lysophospholipase [Purpureocillium lavendulum]